MRRKKSIQNLAHQRNPGFRRKGESFYKTVPFWQDISIKYAEDFLRMCGIRTETGLTTGIILRGRKSQIAKRSIYHIRENTRSLT